MGNKISRRLKKKSKKAAVRKAANLLAAEAMRAVQKQVREANRASRAPRSETYIRCGMRDERLVITHRTALVGGPATYPIVMDAYDVVGMLEDPNEFAALAVRLGVTTLAALLGIGLGKDTTAADVAKALVAFTKIDVEAIQKEIAEEEAKAKADAPAAEVTETQAALAEPQEALQ